MSRSEVSNGVFECLAESLALEPESITPEASLTETLGADSLDFMDIIFALEGRFSIKLKKEDFDLLGATGLSREQAIVDGFLTDVAKQKLRQRLPAFPAEGPVTPSELVRFITVEAVVRIVEEKLAAPPP